MVDQGPVDRALEKFSQVVPRLYRRIQSFRLAVAKEHGISRAQMEILSVLSHRGPLSLTELSVILVLAKSNVTLTVEELVHKGLLEKTRHPVDRRIVLLEATPAGTEVQTRGREEFRNLVAGGLVHLDGAQMEVLIKGLDSLGTMVDLMGE